MRHGRAIRLTTLAAVLLTGALANFAQGPDRAAVDQVFAEFTKPGSPGCALGVFRDGKITYEKGYGLANVEEDVPITPQSVFDIGSTSKQFTAASILLLEKRGKLSVGDDVRKYIPELPDYDQTISLLNLLNHTSGVRDYLTLFELAGINLDGVTTDDYALAMIVRQKKLNFAPGTDYLYSNSGFFLLSVIVKRVSGESLREFAQENVFGPLGMTHTIYRDDHTLLVPHRALAYDPEPNGGYGLDVSYFEQTGDGAVHTTVEDLQRWDENFYSGQVGGKALLAELQEPGKLTSGKTLDYAKGLVIGEYRGLRTVAHGGSWGGYRAQLLRFPDQHFSVACLCNLASANTTRLARAVAEVYLAGLMKPEQAATGPASPATTPEGGVREPKLSPAELGAYAGDYWSDELRVTYRLAARAGNLAIQNVIGADLVTRPAGITRREFLAIAPDEFQSNRSQFTLRFTRGVNHRITGFILDAGRTLGMEFTRIDRSEGSPMLGKP
jgi:CubicO group peptidase (beta-lactamase class C family)